MKLLVLVISSNTESVYAKHREVWRSYMRNTPGVDVFFLEMGTSLELQGDTLYVPGIESFPGIIVKTVEALKYFSVWRYDYVLRTNLSSLWNFPRLLTHIECFPRHMVYAGVNGMNCDIPFVSGAGILMSPDVCSRLLIHSEELLDVNIIDDVDIGKVLHTHGVQRGFLPRIDIVSPANSYDTSGIHYRVKMVIGDCDRSHEPEIMKTILKEW